MPAPDTSRNPRQIIKSVNFGSRSEAALGILAESYIDGWRLDVGKTFQVPIGFNKLADFLIKTAIVEYHPIVLKHEFENSEAKHHFFRAIGAGASEWGRREIRAAIEEEFKMRYYRKRRWALDLHPELKSKELLVVCSPAEVYDQVISRFGNPERLPTKARFLSEWRKLIESFRSI